LKRRPAKIGYGNALSIYRSQRRLCTLKRRPAKIGYGNKPKGLTFS